VGRRCICLCSASFFRSSSQPVPWKASLYCMYYSHHNYMTILRVVPFFGCVHASQVVHSATSVRSQHLTEAVFQIVAPRRVAGDLPHLVNNKAERTARGEVPTRHNPCFGCPQIYWRELRCSRLIFSSEAVDGSWL
jgi:hypothetical protein